MRPGAPPARREARWRGGGLRLTAYIFGPRAPPGTGTPSTGIFIFGPRNLYCTLLKRSRPHPRAPSRPPAPPRTRAPLHPRPLCPCPSRAFQRGGARHGVGGGGGAPPPAPGDGEGAGAEGGRRGARRGLGRGGGGGGGAGGGLWREFRPAALPGRAGRGGWAARVACGHELQLPRFPCGVLWWERPARGGSAKLEGAVQAQ